MDLELYQVAVNDVDSSCLDRSKIDETFHSIHSSFGTLPTTKSLKSAHSDILLRNNNYSVLDNRDNLKVCNKKEQIRDKLAGKKVSFDKYLNFVQLLSADNAELK